MPIALLIIDVQQILCTGRYAAFDVERVIDRINAVSRKARARGALVIVIQHETEGGEMDHGSSAWKLSPALETEASDVFLRKKATDSFHQTDLHAALEASGVTRLVICGLQSEFCVDTTTRRAFGIGLSGGPRLRRTLHAGQRCPVGGADHCASQRDALEHRELRAARRAGSGQ